ncbi:MAG: cell division transport system permease protein [Acidimicrobiales bacterium]|jgi:cell division transport system permease protein
MSTALKRIVRAGFVGFWRNTFVSLAAIFVMTVSLFVVGSTMMIDTLLGVSLENIQDKVDINVYFVTTAQQTDIDLIQTSLEALPDVEEVVFTSREEALATFSEFHKNETIIMQGLEELGENPLEASLSIRAKETSQYEGIASFLSEQQAIEDPQNPLIDKVNYSDNEEAINKLTTIIDAVKNATLIIMAVLVAASILITFNTVRLTVYTTREEISVMRLVGASNVFIRGPFILQGVMYGVAAGVLALLVLYPLILWIGPATEEFFQFNLFNHFVSEFGYIFAVLVGSGVAMGVVSSWLAVSRYLRI